MSEDGPASPSLQDESREKISADNEAKDGRRIEAGDDCDEELGRISRGMGGRTRREERSRSPTSEYEVRVVLVELSLGPAYRYGMRLDGRELWLSRLSMLLVKQGFEDKP